MRRSLLLVLVGMLSGSSANVPRDAPPSGHYSAPVRYDGRFTLVRLRWGADLHPSRSPHAWSHGYPRAEQNLSAIIRELTYLDIHDDGNEILTLDDPDLFKYPIAVMWEPGFWNLTGREAESFRAYLVKGGFAVFEGFGGEMEWGNFQAQMRRVLPDAPLVRLDSSHHIFNAFFPMQGIEAAVDPVSHVRAGYYGIFEDNDPSKRLLVVADYDNAVADDREQSGEGVDPFGASHDAYKRGVNYMIYGLTH